MKKILFISLLHFVCNIYGQNVGVGTITPNASAKLDIEDTNRGLLIPRVSLSSTTDVTTIPSPAISLLVYNNATIADVNPGFYYWNGTVWVRLLNSPSNDWKLDGNNNGTLKFLGTNDNFDLPIETNGTEKMRVTTAGLVGIGTTLPREILQIGDRFTFHNGSSKIIGYNFYNNGVDRYIHNDEASNIVLQDNGEILLRVAPIGTADGPITWKNALRVQNNGSVLGKFRHITYHSLNVGSGWLGNNGTGQILWLPSANGDGEDDCTSNYPNMCSDNFRRHWATPYEGRIVKVTVCIISDGGSNPDIQAGLVFRRINGADPASINTIPFTSTKISLNNKGCQTINIPENTFNFNQGDVIAVGLYKEGNNSDRIEDIDYFVTIVWEYFMWD